MWVCYSQAKTCDIRYLLLYKVTKNECITCSQDIANSRTICNVYVQLLFESVVYGRALGPEGKFLFFVLATFYLGISTS